MPKRIAIEYKCDRCGATWFEDWNGSDTPPETASLTLALTAPNLAKPARELTFDVVCQTCYQTVINYIDHIDLPNKPKVEKKPGAKKEEGGSAPSSSSTQKQASKPEPPSSSSRRSSAPSQEGRSR